MAGTSARGGAAFTAGDGSMRLAIAGARPAPESNGIATASSNQQISTVIILKLGLMHGATYPQPTESYLAKELQHHSPGCRHRGLFKRCLFPLEDVVQEKYSSEEFTAHVYLGHYLVDQLVESKALIFTE